MTDSAHAQPPGDDGQRTQTSPGSQVRGEDIGPYRLLECLGEGGMGEVWLAEQTRPVRRRVAIKLIKAGMDTRQVIARFEAERQALAVMDHPGIAKVFDAGATAQGRPYFAMEHVRGESLTAYCDRLALSTRERLELFVRVCEAVHHAHQKGIIHRDLKPSNILVTLQDDRPVPKVIDFGVSKAISQPLTEHTLYTSLTGFVGTLEYMSPEQADGSADIDIRTDVYALGIILYELLTGTLPFDGHAARERGIEGIRRALREFEPRRPSAVVTQLGATSAQAARRRQTDPARLAGLLRGDLDWITIKALERDRTRRYGSASDLAADVMRHLSTQPVLAGPPGNIYRSRKFIRRHRFGVAAAGVLALLLVAFAGAMIFQARRIAGERDRANSEAQAANEVSSFLVRLFRVSSPSETTANTVTAREILDRGADQIRQDTNLRPSTRARLLATMADVYASLGDYAQARALHEETLALRRDIFGPRSAEAADSLEGVATALARLDQLGEAERLHREALALRRALFGEEHADVAESVHGLASVLVARGQYEEAEPMLREALSLRRTLLGDSEAVGSSLRALGGIFFERGDPAGAERVFREAYELHRKLLGPAHPHTLMDMNNVASTLLLQGHYAEAETIYREVLAANLRTLGPENVQLTAPLSNLGAALFYQRKYAEAEASYREALALARQSYRSDHAAVARYTGNLAESLNAQGRYAEALPEGREALRIARAVLGGEHPTVSNVLVILSATQRELGHAGEAEASAREALEIAVRKLGADHERTKAAEAALGAALARRRKWSEAEPLLLQAAAGEKPDRAAVQHLVDMYTAWGRLDQADLWRAKLTGSASSN